MDAKTLEHKTHEELFQQYLLVARCWNDHALALTHKMTVEKAIGLLREVIVEGVKHKHGHQLAVRAGKLMHDVVYVQDEPQHVNVGGMTP